MRAYRPAFLSLDMLEKQGTRECARAAPASLLDVQAVLSAALLRGYDRYVKHMAAPIQLKINILRRSRALAKDPFRRNRDHF